MTRKKTEMPRREEFLAAALNRFSKFGYMGTSTREICAEVGLVHSAIYNYFPSKEAVVLAIEEREMEAMLNGLQKVVDAPGDIDERLYATVRFVFERSLVRREAWRLMADMIRSLKPRTRSIVVDRRDRFEALVRGVLTEAVSAGIMPPQDTRLASLSLFGIAEGISGWFRKNGPNTMEDVLDHSTSLFLRGVGAEAVIPDEKREAPAPRRRAARSRA